MIHGVVWTPNVSHWVISIDDIEMELLMESLAKCIVVVLMISQRSQVSDSIAGSHWGPECANLGQTEKQTDDVAYLPSSSRTSGEVTFGRHGT